MNEDVLVVMDTLRLAGHQSFLVGGAVRDMLLGVEPHDFDVTTDATPDVLDFLFPDNTPTNRFGTKTVGSGNGPGVEVTTFRKDHQHGDHRRPDAVTFTDSLVDDLARRDFTVNAMAMAQDGTLVDPFGGQNDLSAKLLRTVGDPASRFDEDALRLLRAVRFAARFDLQMTGNTLHAVRVHASDVTFVSTERQGDELMKMLSLPFVQRTRAVGMLFTTGLMAHVLPGAVLRGPVLMERDASVPMMLAGMFKFSTVEHVESTLSRLSLGDKVVQHVVKLLKGTFVPMFDRNDRVSVRRFMFEVGPEFVFDVLTLTGNRHETTLMAVHRECGSPMSLSDLAVDGHDLMRLGFRGPDVGRMLDNLLSMVVNDPNLNSKDVLLPSTKEDR